MNSLKTTNYSRIPKIKVWRETGTDMANTMLKREFNVYSKKNDIHGVIKDYGVVTKLLFTYDGKDIEMGIERNLDLFGVTYEEVGRDIIDSYVANLAVHDEGRKLQFHFWYIDKHEADGVTCKIGHGIVTGHKKLEDSMFIHTSVIQAIHLDEEAGELVMTTKNSVYHCPLEYCDYDEQDKNPELIPDYKKIKKKYKDAIQFPSAKPGQVLLVLANFCNYYFHSLYYVPKDSVDKNPLEYEAWPHVGMFQDSYLVSTNEAPIDIRYFPHYQNIEFYSECTDGKPFFIENIGDITLYAQTRKGTIKLEPGDRKKVEKASAEHETPVLPGGDLYPAGIIE